jgi:hypothetical protein
MERKMYEPTKGNEKKWARFADIEMPSDDEFKARWANRHGGKTRGWGMAKRDFVLSQMTQTREYQMGLWQGRVDKARGLEYSEDRNENTYNLGYYRGYTEYESNRRGWDRETRRRFDEKYIEEE